MNFHRYLAGVIIFLIGIVFVSCESGLLDRTPRGLLTKKTFFKSESDLKLYANELYSFIPTLTPLKEMKSGNLVPTSPNPFLAGNYTVPTTSSMWDWDRIRYCNYFLDHFKTANVSKSIKNKYAAEIRFMRAWLYWDKVKHFGAVPLIKHALTDTSDALYKPRTPRKVVMDFVLADLNFAIKHLPPPAEAEVGRLNKHIALALKARISLWEGTYRKYHNLGDHVQFLKAALTASQRIMESGNYHLYSTDHPGTDYRNMFLQKDLSNDPETIMSKKYISNVLTHNLTRTLLELGVGWSLDFINSFLCRDGKPVHKSSVCDPNASIKKMAANRDPRLAQMVAIPGDTVLGKAGTPQVLSRPRIGTGVTSTGFEVTKMKSNKTSQWVANQSTLDLFIFRYDEILLIYAEAKAELANLGVGTFTQADLDKSINLLRDRVGMPPMKINVPIDPNLANKYPEITGFFKNVILEIRRERRIELAGEGFRFADLLRWKAGELIEQPKTMLGLQLTSALKKQYPPSQLNNINLSPNGFIDPYPGITKRNWTKKMYLYPIPTRALTLNESLTQNPGW